MLYIGRTWSGSVTGLTLLTYIKDTTKLSHCLNALYYIMLHCEYYYLLMKFIINYTIKFYCTFPIFGIYFNFFFHIAHDNTLLCFMNTKISESRPILVC
jgi:hypothetical protein